MEIQEINESMRWKFTYDAFGPVASLQVRERQGMFEVWRTIATSRGTGSKPVCWGSLLPCIGEGVDVVPGDSHHERPGVNDLVRFRDQRGRGLLGTVEEIIEDEHLETFVSIRYIKDAREQRTLRRINRVEKA